MARFSSLLCIAAAMIAGAAMPVLANGDPVVKHSSVNRVANPEPLSVSEIRIVDESVRITHSDGYNCFDVTYRLKNDSDKDFPEIHYGFPIDYLVADEEETERYRYAGRSESIHALGWNDRLIRDVAFIFDSRELPFHSARESVREAGYKVEPYRDGGETVVSMDTMKVDGINRRWFYTMFSMKAGTEATLTVRYKVYADAIMSLADEGNGLGGYSRQRGVDAYSRLVNAPWLYPMFTSRFAVLYDFSPARHFGDGKPYNLKVDIDMSGLRDARIRPAGSFDYYSSARIQLESDKPVAEVKPIDLIVSFDGSMTTAEFNRRIEPYSIPSSAYTLTSDTAGAELTFTKPAFVSEIVCDVDTSDVASIDAVVTRADGQVDRYTYVRSRGVNALGDKALPVALLTVTDIFNVGLSNRVDGEEPVHPEVKSVKLTYSRNPASRNPRPAACIRPLDSRHKSDAAVKRTPGTTVINPTPRQMTMSDTEHLFLGDSFSLNVPEELLDAVPEHPRPGKLSVPGVFSVSGGDVSLTVSYGVKAAAKAGVPDYPEAYRVIIDKDGITVTGRDRRSAISGLRTLGQILKGPYGEVNVAPFCDIADWPEPTPVF